MLVFFMSMLFIRCGICSLEMFNWRFYDLFDDVLEEYAVTMMVGLIGFLKFVESV